MRLLPLLLLPLHCTCVHATNYYVSPTGDDANDGLTTTTAFATPQHAADLTVAGDTVNIMSGTYRNDFTWQDLLYISRSGAAGAPIVYRGFGAGRPLLEFNGWHGIKLEGGVSYVVLEGLDVRGNNANILLADALDQPGGCNDPTGSPDGFFNGNGIASDGRFQGKNHHITVRDCRVWECAGVGISAIHTDYVTIENCEVWDNAWYAIYGTSGISIYQPYNFDADPGARIVIRNNRVYGNRMFVPWIDAPCAITDGNGIIIDDARNTQNGSTNGVYTGRTLIENNVVYDNGGRGIHVFESDRVDILNNTVVNNGASPEISDGEITAIFADDVNVFNNIMVARTGEKVNTAVGTNIVFDYNLHSNSTQRDRLGGNSVVTAGPGFTDAAAGDYTLQTGSPAIDAGTAVPGRFAPTDAMGLPRPAGMAPDMGAFEFSTTLPVVYAGGLSARALGKDAVLLEWRTVTEDGHDRFEVLHLGGDDAWRKVGTLRRPLPGTDNGGGSARRYRFRHSGVSPGRHHYRLRQVDHDGTASLSPTVGVTLRAAVRLLSNPAREQIRLRYTTAGPLYYALHSADGRLRARGRTNGDISTVGLAAGVYVLRLRGGDGEELEALRVVVR